MGFLGALPVGRPVGGGVARPVVAAAVLLTAPVAFAPLDLHHVFDESFLASPAAETHLGGPGLGGLAAAPVRAEAAILGRVSPQADASCENKRPGLLLLVAFQARLALHEMDIIEHIAASELAEPDLLFWLTPGVVVALTNGNAHVTGLGTH